MYVIFSDPGGQKWKKKKEKKIIIKKRAGHFFGALFVNNGPFAGRSLALTLCVFDRYTAGQAVVVTNRREKVSVKTVV